MKRGWILALLSTAAMVGVIGAAARCADGDMAHLVAVEIRVAQMIRDGALLDALRFWWALIAPQPPIGYLPGILAFTVFGARAFVAPLTMGVALLLCWDALARLWGTRAWAGWLALVASPLVWLGVEQHGRDLWCAAALLQAASWVVRSDTFADRRGSVAFGVWLGVGFMTKYTFPVFAVFVCLVAGGRLVLASSRARWVNLGWGVLGWLGPAGAWYLGRGTAVLQYVGFSYGDDMAGNTANFRDPWALANLAYYPLALRDAFSLPGLVVVLVAVAVGLRRDRGLVAPLLAAAVGGIAVLSTLPEAIDRYALPAFVALAAVVPAVATRRWVAPLLLLVFVPQGLASAVRFWPGSPTSAANYDHPLASASELAWPSPSTYRPSDLRPADWRLDEAAAAIRQAQGRPDGTIGVLGGRGPDAGPTFATLLLATAARGYHYDFATINTFPAPGAPDVFVGPLFDGERPSAAFTTLLVVRPAHADGAIDRWLGQHPAEETARIPGPNGGVTQVYRLRGSR